ncbi:PAS domain S-box protein [Halostella salina]|uniref:PAS domain S-box protein n=1 Tax=Halostella salina TaxID=1547897 RepID=UPI000EF82176|nr:PAS domain S-box protein [Halostella salina]
MSTNTPIHVLHVDDDRGFTDMVAKFLEREDEQLTVHTATTAAEGLERLDRRDIDCVVSDYDMPDRNGIELLNEVRDSHPDLPFILFTGKGSEEIASDAISAGVTDYLQKEGGTGQYTLLAHRIPNAVAQYQSQREIEASQERLSLFFDQSPLGAIEWTDELEVSRINGTAESILGYDEDELVGSSWERLVPESGHDDIATVFTDLLGDATAYDTEQETLTGDGERIICEWHHRVVRNELGDVVTMFSKFQDVTERVQRQEKLARERAFTEQALDTLDDLFYVIDADGTLSRWNQRLAEITGYTDTELAGLDALELFPEDERSRVAEAIDRTMNTGSAMVEADLLTASGGRVPHELVGKRLTDPHGDFLGLVGVGRDLSDRKERQAELEFIRDLLARTERIADVGGWEIDTATEEVYWTDHLFDMLGAEYDEEPPLEEALDFYVEEDRQRVAAAVEAALDAEESFDVEARYRRSDSGDRWFRIQGEPVVEDGEVVTIRGAVQDISDRRQRERVLREMHDIISNRDRSFEEQVRALLELGRTELDTQFGTLSRIRDDEYIFEIVAADDDSVRAGDVVPVSATNCEIVASTEETLVLGDIERDAPEETHRAGFSEWGVSCYIGAPVYADDGVYGTFCFYGTEPRNGQFSEWEETLVDLMSRWVSYELQRQQANERLSEQNEQLEQFASVVSHDLRNPLNVAEGNLKLAREECDSDHLAEVERAHARMRVLIEDILTLARDEDTVGEIEAIDLGALVESCWQTVETAEATLRTETDARVRADRSRLKQLLENLVRNAVEHGGDEVTITVGDLADGFYVADDGPGIPEDEREEVFDLGYSTTTDGTGFGLSIAKQVADAHGWAIDLATSADGGARIEVTGVAVAEGS